MSREEALQRVFTSICSGDSLDKVFIRRWGTRNSFKASKIVAYLKKHDYNLYIMVLNELGCESDTCLSKSITAWVYRTLKSSYSNIYTLGELCHAVLEYNY